jgi:predicted GH43/DUF377 family glycosyl hydrolase
VIQTVPASLTEADATLMMSPCGVAVRRLPIRFTSDDRRVITRPLIMGGARVRSMCERIDKLEEDKVVSLLDHVLWAYSHRHPDLIAEFEQNFHTGAALIGWSPPWSPERQLLAGAYLSMEYSVDSAALFNPSIVPHPQQEGAADGSVDFVMSLRATGEGHVSSIVFRTGRITPHQQIKLDPPPAKLHRSRIAPDRWYVRHLFDQKLREMGIDNPVTQRVLSLLQEHFTIGQLHDATARVRPEFAEDPGADQVLRTMLWLAHSNYHVYLSREAQLSELVIFPMSEEESRGIEDLRLVRFVDDDHSVTYFGTYTAYDGIRTIPMLLATRDFRRMEIHSLNGPAAQNKGMALFPRRINGRYVMCSRIDGENLFIMYSEQVHFWNNAHRLKTPKSPWELLQIGNCGAPMETPAGWLLLTHGVGPMRTYSIGALLLDLNDPLKVIGQLHEPLLTPVGDEREGYVPNVVYTCGAMIHRGHIYIPYAQADKSTTIAVVKLDELLKCLLESPPA